VVVTTGSVMVLVVVVLAVVVLVVEDVVVTVVVVSHASVSSPSPSQSPLTLQQEKYVELSPPGLLPSKSVLSVGTHWARSVAH
jgi:hypothetical protein